MGSYLDDASSGAFRSEIEDVSSTDDGHEVKKNDTSREQVAKLAIQETRNVRMWRRNVFLMLFATAALVTTLTFLFLRDEDVEDFETAVRRNRCT